MERNDKKCILHITIIDSARFVARSLSNLVINLSEGNHEIKCKCGHNDKKDEICGITYEACNCFLEYTDFKDDLIEYKCLCCNKNYQQIPTNFLTTTIISFFIVAKRCLSL